jgi:DNA-binding transcriptional regulator LsrR (DeoR family)
MNDLDNPNLTATIVQVAHMYYEQNLSQQQIADNLGMSRSLIALYLKKARELQIVKIEISDPQDNCEDLALLIKAKTSLHRVVVVPSSHNSAALTRRSIAGALARHLEHSLQDGDCLGIGFGRTMAEVADLLVPSKPRKIDVLPVVGESSSGLVGTYSQVNLHILKIASSFSGTPHFLLAPLLVHSDILHDMLIADEIISPVIDYWNNLTHICIGIGTLPPIAGEVIYIGEENLNVFIEAGGVGDICSRYYDSAGNFINMPLYNRIIGINVDQIRKTKHIMAVASGPEKAKATASLLKAHLITELFVDEDLARAILNELRK